MSKIFALAASRWRVMRAEYENYREGAYLRAETACNGVLLNERGKRAGVNPYGLFIGPEVRALAYASEELVEHWRQYPRMTFAQFEAETLDVEDGAA
ncbi:MAG: serine/threonine kinase [Schumannella sp.]|nr:serine/threonine kinase [Schumannella sp.]